MFSGIFQKEFDKSVSIETISKKLSAIGFTRISDNRIFVTSHETNFSFESEIIVNLLEGEQKNTLQVHHTFSPKFIAWVLGICFFPFGLLIFILPYKANENTKTLLYTIF